MHWWQVPEEELLVKRQRPVLAKLRRWHLIAIQKIIAPNLYSIKISYAHVDSIQLKAYPNPNRQETRKSISLGPSLSSTSPFLIQQQQNEKRFKKQNMIFLVVKVEVQGHVAQHMKLYALSILIFLKFVWYQNTFKFILIIYYLN